MCSPIRHHPPSSVLAMAAASPCPAGQGTRFSVPKPSTGPHPN
uniref:Uncharacterized protein n=1 Tax=Arundo donax TaxID=35708 RepID=A0A0A9BA04_ARUDO